MLKISAVIITYNEAANICRCIDSVKDVVDEIVVVDSFSKDATPELAKAKGVVFLQHPFTSHREQKNVALAHASHDYILSLDADEYLSSELRESIRHAKTTGTFSAYSMNRLSSWGGKWVRHGNWYPDRKIRLWDRRLGKWGGDNPHEKVILDASVKDVCLLRGDLFHNGYKNAQDALQKIQKYSDIFAQENRFKRKSSMWQMMIHPTFAFFKSFVIKRGFLDGFEGLMVAAASSSHAFYKYAKLYEANRQDTLPATRASVVASPATSLVITTYNRKDALELVLLSALNQSVLPSEIIIADDGSRPDTADLIAYYTERSPIPVVHCWQEDLGFRLAAVRNLAIAQAKGDYIIMVDGDIVLHRHFVKSHLRYSAPNRFIQGSRVLLQERLTRQAIAKKETAFSFFSSGVKSRFNALYLPWFSRFFSYQLSDLTRTRGCNQSFWKADIYEVNGFNEDFLGWGREDTEFMVRMLNAGKHCFKVKLEGFGYHLYHPESSKKMLEANQQILDEAISRKSKHCANGIDKYSEVLVA